MGMDLVTRTALPSTGTCVLVVKHSAQLCVYVCGVVCVCVWGGVWGVCVCV